MIEWMKTKEQETQNQSEYKPNQNPFVPALYHDQKQYPYTLLHLRNEWNERAQETATTYLFLGFMCEDD